MGEISNEQEFFKVNRLGHVRVPKERREALLDEFERCGVSAWEFASTIGVNYSTFAGWRQRRSRERAALGSASNKSSPKVPALPAGGLRWVEAVVDGSAVARGPVAPTESAPHFAGSAAKSVHVQLPGGARLEIVDAAQAVLVAELLRALDVKGAPAC